MKIFMMKIWNGCDFFSNKLLLSSLSYLIENLDVCVCVGGGGGGGGGGRERGGGADINS